ncbi:MAG: hypothetical protein IPH61_12390 [Bacteroidetes bacterium]|nr:hypothetical protein [Bacteroidota bacterium]
MTILNKNEILEYSLSFISDDYTEIWVIIKRIQQSNPQFSFDELVQATVTIISELMSNYNVVLINPETEKYWDMTKYEALNYIQLHLLKLNKIPTIGDGIWLSIKE